MSDETTAALKSLNKTNRAFQWILGVMASVFVAQLTIFGSLKANVKTQSETIITIQKQMDFLGKDYVPTWFLEGMYQNMTYQTEEIVATINGDGEKIKDINDKYTVFQKTMLNNLIQHWGGRTNITRSAKSQTLEE